MTVSPLHLPPDGTDESPAPRRWEAIAAELQRDITEGRLPPGQKLPNEATLATRFAVNRHTLRQAVQALAREGYVRVVQGSGTFVRELVLDYALRKRTRLSQNLSVAGESAERELVAHEQVRGGEWAREMDLAASAPLQLMYTRALVRGRPVGISTAAYPLPRLDGIVEAFGDTGSVTSALARLGVPDYTRARSVVSCRLPTAAEADALARPATQPVLVVRYLNVDAEREPVSAGQTLFAADAIQLTVEPDA